VVYAQAVALLRDPGSAREPAKPSSSRRGRGGGGTATGRKHRPGLQMRGPADAASPKAASNGGGGTGDARVFFLRVLFASQKQNAGGSRESEGRARKKPHFATPGHYLKS
jgi:hypothetical protein